MGELRHAAGRRVRLQATVEHDGESTTAYYCKAVIITFDRPGFIVVELMQQSEREVQLLLQPACPSLSVALHFYVTQRDKFGKLVISRVSFPVNLPSAESAVYNHRHIHRLRTQPSVGRGRNSSCSAEEGNSGICLTAA